MVWNALDGTKHNVDYIKNAEKISVKVNIQPYSSLLIVFGDSVPKALPFKRVDFITPLNEDWKISFDGKEIISNVKRIPSNICKTDSITYDYDVFIENAGDWAVLKFSELHNICKVEINGEQAGIVLWKPYEIETDLLKNGKNHIKITVYTTAAATLNEKALPYGIEGPVVLEIMECTEEKK